RGTGRRRGAPGPCHPTHRTKHCTCCQKPTLLRRCGFRQQVSASVRCCACWCEGRRGHWLVVSGAHRLASGKEVRLRRQHARRFSRRQFPGGLTLAGTAGLLGWHPRPVAAEPPPETTKIRLFEAWPPCLAPTWVAQDLLYSEGFTDVQY